MKVRGGDAYVLDNIEVGVQCVSADCGAHGEDDECVGDEGDEKPVERAGGDGSARVLEVSGHTCAGKDTCGRREQDTEEVLPVLPAHL